MNTEKYIKEFIRILPQATCHSEIEKVLSNAVLDGNIVQRPDLYTYICGDYIIYDNPKI